MDRFSANSIQETDRRITSLLNAHIWAGRQWLHGVIYYFATAAVTVDSSHMTASPSTSWSRFSPPSNSVNGHVSTMWFCRWPQSQEGDWVRPHLRELAQQKWFVGDHVWRSRWKPMIYVNWTLISSSDYSVDSPWLAVPASCIESH